MPESKDSSNNNKVTVEDLLQFKREERPDEAFWASFDQSLHEKTLQTLIQKKQSKQKILWKWGIWTTSSLAASAALYLSFGIFLQLADTEDGSSPDLLLVDSSDSSHAEDVDLRNVESFARFAAEGYSLSMSEYLVDELLIDAGSHGDMQYQTIHASSSMSDLNSDNIYQQNLIQSGEANVYLASMPAFDQF